MPIKEISSARRIDRLGIIRLGVKVGSGGLWCEAQRAGPAAVTTASVAPSKLRKLKRANSWPSLLGCGENGHRRLIFAPVPWLTAIQRTGSGAV